MTAIRRRIDDAYQNILASGEVTAPIYMHEAFCQMALPYEATSERVWQQRAGDLALRIEAGSVPDPKMPSGWRDIPLPQGKKVRLLLAHLSTEAMRGGQETVDVGDSLTRFAYSLGMDANGRNLNDLRTQITSLSQATVKLSVGGTAEMANVLALWPERRITKWPGRVRLDPAFVRSLLTTAVPLDRRIMHALQNSAAAMDTYAWVCFCLHRNITESTSWQSLWQRFGVGYKLLRQFRFIFKHDLAMIGRLMPETDIQIGPTGVRVIRRPIIPPTAPTRRDKLQFTLPLPL